MLAVIICQIVGFLGVYYLGYASGRRAGIRQSKITHVPIAYSMGLKEGKKTRRRR